MQLSEFPNPDYVLSYQQWGKDTDEGKKKIRKSIFCCTIKQSSCSD